MKRHLILALSGCFLASAATAAAPAKTTGANSVFLEDLTTDELKAKIAHGCPVALIFSASTEETGPHVALGKHIFRARVYSEAIARALGDAVVAPILPFAPFAIPPTPALPGSINLKPDTFYRVNEEVARSLIAGGIKRIALLSDHGGDNQVALHDIAAKLDAELGPGGTHVYFISDGYDKARLQIEQEIRTSGGVPGGHGGLWDTAETMAANPDAVRPEKFHPGTLSQDGNGPVNEEGFSGDPRKATAALGKHFGEIRVKLATAELKAALAASGPCH